MKVTNRKFHREYEEIERIEAGIALTGAEVKSVRAGNIRLEDSFVKLMDDGVYLVNADIPVYKFSRPQGYDSRRSRKLLLHKKEVLRMRVKIGSGSRLTLAPIACYNKGGLFKIEIALARGRRDLEKKKLDKQRDIEIDEKRMVKEYMRT